MPSEHAQATYCRVKVVVGIEVHWDLARGVSSWSAIRWDERTEAHALVVLDAGISIVSRPAGCGVRQ